MDAVEFLKEKNRLCRHKSCNDCPLGTMLSCNAYKDSEVEKIVAKVKRWSEEHPIKTRQSEFLRKFPNAIKDKNGILHIIPCALDVKYKTSCCNDLFCSECRKNYWLQEVE